ncbi:MAG TPA: LuxR C-terminal-related transcriptional regulator [Geomonas sp.]
MENLKKIAAKRSAPGVLILDLEDRLLYSNSEALEMLCVLQEADGEQQVPGEVYDLCRQLRAGPHGLTTASGVIRQPGADADADGMQVHYSLRALALGHHGDGVDPSHVMVLMEKIIRNRRIDFEEARRKFLLSKREAEIVRLISQGLSNKEISAAIFISEFTVKDHLKNIMRKMAAGSRNEIIAALL